MQQKGTYNIGNVLNGRGYAGNSVHHYSSWFDRKKGEQIALKLGLSSNPSITSEMAITTSQSFFSNEYSNLPLEFRQYLSAETQGTRHALGHISTEEYWTNLDADTQKVLFEQFTNSAGTSTSLTIESSQ